MWTYIKCSLYISSRSSHKLQAACIIVYDLTAAWTEPRPTPHACVGCRATANWAVVASRWSARWTHSSPWICWHMRRNGLQICLFQFKIGECLGILTYEIDMEGKKKKLTVQDYLLLVAHPWVILLPSSPKLSLALFYVSWSWTAFFAWELYRGKQKTEVWLTSMNFSLSAGRAFELNPGTFAVYEL